MAGAPEADADSAAWWEGLRAGRIELQACTACERRRFPPMPACPYCGEPGGRPEAATGAGTVYSWVRVHRDLSGSAPVPVPYVVATVELDGGGRVFGVVEPGDGVAIGGRVAPRLVDHGTWSELRFTPEAGVP